MKSGNQGLQKYLSDYWERILRDNPTFATYIGDHRYNDKLEDLSEESITAQNKFFQSLLSKVERIDASTLRAEQKLNHALLRRGLTDHLEDYQFQTYCIPLNHMSGPHIDLPQLIEYHPFRSGNDVEQYILRLNAFPLQIDQVIENLRKGVERDMTAFQGVMGHVLGQVETFTKLSHGRHPLYSPLSKMSGDFSGQEKKDLKLAVREAITSKVTPAYEKLHHYLRGEYLRHCREEAGIWALPRGEGLYRFSVQYHTTTDLSPEEIHEIGQQEVREIGGEIRKIIGKTGHPQGIREFADKLKGRKALYPVHGREILDGYRDILSRMDRRLQDFFGRLPRATYDIKEIEPYREQAAPAAYYYSPPRDFSRPGYFYVNTYKPEERPRFVMEALSYHEAVPGHHLQIALMQEREDIPDFRRYGGATAFIEGWALYAERLAREMGFYADDLSEYGRLTFAIWRAARLVVDTGLHHYRWSRDRSIQYCREHTGLEDHDIGVEVDRYIAMPGQALAYKIGERKILSLREKAREALGPGFQIREFHDRILENGALPLDILEDVMNEWIQKNRSRMKNQK